MCLPQWATLQCFADPNAHSAPDATGKKDHNDLSLSWQKACPKEQETPGGSGEYLVSLRVHHIG